jgi:hypothetical protein
MQTQKIKLERNDVDTQSSNTREREALQIYTIDIRPRDAAGHKARSRIRTAQHIHIRKCICNAYGLQSQKSA